LNNPKPQISGLSVFFALSALVQPVAVSYFQHYDYTLLSRVF